MSLRPGTSIQPESSTSSGTSSAAPQRGQLATEPSETSPHHEHFADACLPAMSRVIVAGGVAGGYATGALLTGSGLDGYGDAALTGSLAAGVFATGVPQPTQKLAASGIRLPHCTQNMLAPLFRVMMHVHRLNADASRTRHPRERHVRAAEQARTQVLELDVHRHRRIFIEERARFHHDRLSRSQPAFENVAVAVQD